MMSFFKDKEPWVKPFSEKVARRVSKIPTGELEMWSEQALIDISRCLSSYSKNRDMLFLNEALQGSEALHAVVNELHIRMKSR